MWSPCQGTLEGVAGYVVMSPSHVGFGNSKPETEDKLNLVNWSAK